MMPKVSRFERRIIIAIFLAATVPFVISVIFIPQIIETRLALSMHTGVREQLEDSALFYKDFFDAKKSEYSARAQSIASDPILIRAARDGSVDDVKVRLAQVLTDNEEIRSARVITFDEEILVALDGPEERMGDGFVPKTIVLPLGLGDAPKLEIVFILSRKYLADRAHAEEIARLYDASLRTEDQRSRTFYLTYIAISAFVLFLSLAVGYLLARSVTRRVSQLALATERVAKGESGFTVPLGGDDEITELTNGFNRMIEEVAEARDRIVYLEKVSGWQEFARRLAHEIKNPLTPIRLAIQELRRRAPDSEPRFKKLVDDASDVVEEEIGALTRLVGEFSQFARLPEVTPSPVDASRFVHAFLNAYNGFEPDAAVEVDLPADPLTIAVDRVLMRRVLANLVMNGIQAAGKGNAKLWIRIARIPATGLVEIRVEDNGPGVPQDVAEKVFEPYYTTKTEGTGLGLAIVKKIVLQHGGSIALRRSPVGGASFVILLPPAPHGAVPEEDSEMDEALDAAAASVKDEVEADETPISKER
ncbi:MAG: ATP-binding protein [Deltaproteobacteria bacterium]|jgi:two-component system nitrogen regulation sensor histidine kinase NtrY